MKIPRLPLLLTITLVFGLLLSSCSTGAAPVNTWPGLSAGANVVYLAYQTSVFAVDINSGSMTWRFPDKSDSGKSFYASPAIADDQVVAGSYTNAVYSLEPASGAQRWSYAIETGYHFVASPLVVNQVTLAPSSDYSLYAIDQSGNKLWSFKTGNVLWAQPSSDGELVYLPAMDHNLYALRLNDGSEAWRADLGSSVLGGAVLQDEVLYVGTMAGKVFGVNAKDGQTLWSYDLGEKIWSAPVFVDGSLYLGTSAGNVYALRTDAAAASTSRVIWKFTVDGAVVGSGAVTSKGLVFVTENGVIQALGFDGQGLWSQKVNGKLYTTPVVVNDTLVVAATGGDALMTAYNVDGGQKWIFTVPK